MSMPRVTTAMADPPWKEDGGGGRGAQNHYPTLSTPEILRVMRSCEEYRAFAAEPRAHLYMWTTSNFRGEAHWLLDALGWRYITDFVWLKTRPATGQYRFSRHEHLLLADRSSGAPMLPAKAYPSSVIEAPQEEHSKKPAVFYELVEQISPGPYLEIFARNLRPGWTSWGNDPRVVEQHLVRG